MKETIVEPLQIIGDKAREAIDALKGYTYQLYQSAIAWVELKDAEFLKLEVAEDYAIISQNVLQAVQVKDTKATTTINTEGVVRAIDSLIKLREQNPNFDVSVRYLSTSSIGTERNIADRTSNGPTLAAWRKLAKSGDTSELRRVLQNSKIDTNAKKIIAALDEDQFREQILRKIHFDCGAAETLMLRKALQERLRLLLEPEGGTFSQIEYCETMLLHHLLLKCSEHGDRCLSKTDLKSIVENVTRVSISQADFDKNNKILSSLIPAAISPSGIAPTTIASSLRTIPSLPNTYISRDGLVQLAHTILRRYGLAWLHGATGIGKTSLARIVASQHSGNWSGANLRGLDPSSTRVALELIANQIPSVSPSGIIIDDLEDTSDQSAADALQYLLHTADRLDIPVIITSASSAPFKVRSILGVNEDVSLKIPDFEEDEIGMILQLVGGNANLWKKYIYLASGGGHPQLAQALIQNLQYRNWPLEEIETLSFLLTKNPATEEIRTECRKRLLRELPEGALTLLQRLSLHLGKFPRQLVIDIALLSPEIANAGFLFDNLVGPWVDQVDTKYYQLSPLLSGLAAQSLSELQQRSVHYGIADSLTSGSMLNVSDMYSAVPSALLSQNEHAITKFCMAILHCPIETLQVIAEQMDILCYLSPDSPPFKNHTLNQIFRGVQLLICLHSGISQRNIDQVLARFQSEGSLIKDEKISSGTELLIYTKILISNPRGLTLENFIALVERLHILLLADSLTGPDIQLKQTLLKNGENMILGFALVLQLAKTTKIKALNEIFNFIDNTDPELRTELLAPLSKPEFNADMFVSPAWLAEHSAGTIDCNVHARVFEELENISIKWGCRDISVSCCKYRAVILDEYGKRGNDALMVLNSGLNRYGLANSELLRAKAKVLYRADDYRESLNISRGLIENNLIDSAVERAFLGRDAAISAEHERDYTTARQYYLYARQAAQEAGFGDMIPMATGLLADACLAAWHANDRKTCLNDFITVLEELQQLNTSDSLIASHIRAVSNHVLLWLDQEATREAHLLEDGRPTQIYPGCVSNPSPHKDIAKRKQPVIGLSWYMLAKIECEIDAGCSITENLGEHLPNGRFLEGESLLHDALLRNSLMRLDSKGFQNALTSILSEQIHQQENRDIYSGSDVNTVTFGVFSNPSIEQLSRLQDLVQIYTLVFCGACIVKDNTDALDRYIDQTGRDADGLLEEEFIHCLRTGESRNGFNSNFAALIAKERKRTIDGKVEDPTTVCLFAINLISSAAPLASLRCMDTSILNWYEACWKRILANQRFQLINPMLYVKDIEALMNSTVEDPLDKLLNLVLLTLPTTRFSGQGAAREALLKIQRKYGLQSRVS